MSEKATTILQVIPQLESGGAEKTTLEVAEAVIIAGGRAIIATTDGAMISDAQALGATVVTRNLKTKNPYKLAANATWLSRLVREENVNLIHARSRAPAWSAERAARANGVPFVTTYHGAYNETSRIKKAYNRIMARGDVVIANSAYISNLVQSRYATPPDRIRTINRGVDLDAFDPDAVDAKRASAMRALLGLDATDQRPLIVHPARLTRWKGQTTVIDAAARLKTDGRPQAVFVLAGHAQGRTAYVDELKARLKEHNLSDTVLLPGHITDIPALLAIARGVLIASTDPEAFGRTSAEAQAMGVPVIATNIGAPRDTVRASADVAPDETTGWHVPPGDAEALADALAELLSLPETAYAALSQRAMTYARAAFSTRQLQAQTLAVYDDLLRTSLCSAFSSTKAKASTQT
ncbi:MAG: glycosyltransferase family 4 protein [Pseudomonadota bacterium]